MGLSTSLKNSVNTHDFNIFLRKDNTKIKPNKFSHYIFKIRIILNSDKQLMKKIQILDSFPFLFFNLFKFNSNVAIEKKNNTTIDI